MEGKEKFVCFSVFNENTNACEEEELKSACSNTANSHWKFSSYPLPSSI